MTALIARLPALWSSPSPLALRRWLPVLGPAYVVAVGYIDPGNWATDVAAGARYGFALLSVVLAASLAAAFLQVLAVRLTLATGKDLARLIRERLPRPLALLCWGVAEIAMVATDMAELLGAAVALKLLFGLPVAAGVLLAAGFTLALLSLPLARGRMPEYAVGLLLAVIAAAFAYELGLAHPPPGALARGFLPDPRILHDPDMLYLAIGIIGATIMPHNLYLHSGLAQAGLAGAGLARAAEAAKFDTPSIGAGTRGDPDRRQILRFLSLDSWTMLGLACLANAAIVVVAAMAFGYGAAAGAGGYGAAAGAGRHGVAGAGLEEAYRLLDPVFGAGAGAVFAVALLAAGLSATTTAGMAGQIVIEGFFDLRIPVALRALLTRGAALGPALLLPLAMGAGGVDRLLVLSQVVLGLALPFVLVPMLLLLADRRLMIRLPLGRRSLGLAGSLALLLIGLNLWLVA
jgi:manganese transport protein